MASKDTPSWTTKIGGNRTIVLGIMVLMLCLFTVEDYILKAVGLGSRGGEYVKFSVHGRPVAIDIGKFQAQFQDWQRFQTGQAMISRREPRTGEQEFLTDVMMTELARDSGAAITDGTLREFIESFPLFSDGSGNFDPANFDKSREQIYQGITARGLEEEIRRFLLLDHFRKIYANSFLTATDDEAYKRWKADHPKLEIACAWSAVAPLRAAMKPEEAKAEEIEALWKDEKVQKRHRTPRKYAFEAAWVVMEGVEDKAFVEAREAWKGEADLALGENEGFEYWTARKDFDFSVAPRDPEILERLRKENEARVKAEDEERAKKPAAPPPAPAPKEEEGEEARAPAAPAGDRPYEALEPWEQYRLYWQFRIEKEIGLKKLLGKVQKEFSEGKSALPAVAARWSRPGLEVKTHAQETPVDQYEVEKIPGVGGPNCPLRYSLNSVTEADLGKMNPEVLTWSSVADRLELRGWLVYVLRKVVPDAVPPLEAVKDKVAGEVLDDRAKDAARLLLETLRRDAEGARKPLEDAAKEKGMETQTVGPFNEYTWRPPAFKVGTGEKDAAAGEGWKVAERRASAVMGRYSSFRDTPVGSFSTVLDDTSGTGASYLAQVKSRSDPAFEEMTQAQLLQAKRALVRERLGVVGQELSYGRLKEKLSLQIGGKPAPEPEDFRRSR